MSSIWNGRVWWYQNEINIRVGAIGVRRHCDQTHDDVFANVTIFSFLIRVQPSSDEDHPYAGENRTSEFHLNDLERKLLSDNDRCEALFNPSGHIYEMRKRCNANVR